MMLSNLVRKKKLPSICQQGARTSEISVIWKRIYLPDNVLKQDETARIPSCEVIRVEKATFNQLYIQDYRIDGAFDPARS